MSPESLFISGLTFVLVPTIQAGGRFLLASNTTMTQGYLDNQVRQNLLRAGHAHAGVLVILALVSFFYVDHAALSEELKALVRWSMFAAPLLMSGGFFFSMLPPTATKPNSMIWLLYLGAVSLAVGVITLGVGLLRA